MIRLISFVEGIGTGGETFGKEGRGLFAGGHVDLLEFFQNGRALLHQDAVGALWFPRRRERRRFRPIDLRDLKPASLTRIEYAAVGDHRSGALAGVQTGTGRHQPDIVHVGQINDVQVGTQQVRLRERETGAFVASGHDRHDLSGPFVQQVAFLALAMHENEPGTDRGHVDGQIQGVRFPDQRTVFGVEAREPDMVNVFVGMS